MKIKISGFSSVLFLIFLMNCSKSYREDIKEDYNKFLYEKKIDTSLYHTLAELRKENRAEKIVLGERPADPFINTETNTLILQLPGYGRYQKLDCSGNILDSLKIEEEYTFLQHYILADDYYMTWLHDGNNSKKKIKNLHVNPEDTLRRNTIIGKILDDRLSYIIKSEKETTKPAAKDSIPEIYSYAYFVEDRQIFKVNIGEGNRDFHGLKYNGYENRAKEIFRDLKTIDKKTYITFDNYYAKQKIFHPVNCAFFSVNGCGPDRTYYTGTAFLSFKNYGIKIKYHKNQDIGSVDSPEDYFDIYSDASLDFLIINDDPFNHPYSILKKQKTPQK